MTPRAEAPPAPGMAAPDIAVAAGAPLVAGEVHVYTQVYGTVALEPRDCERQMAPFAVWHQSDLGYREVLGTEPPEPATTYRYVRPGHYYGPSPYDDGAGYEEF